MIEEERVIERFQAGIIDSLKEIGKRQKNIKPTSLIEKVCLPVDARLTKCVARIAGFTNKEIEAHIKEGFGSVNLTSN